MDRHTHNWPRCVGLNQILAPRLLFDRNLPARGVVGLAVPPPHTMSTLLAAALAATLVGLAKTLLLTLIAVLNAVLAFLAALATWKTYLAIGAKVGLIVLFCVPVLGVLLFIVWGQRVVRDNQK